MEVNYSSRLVEKVLFEEIRQRERGGDKSLREKYHKLADPLYALPPGARDTEFKKLNLELFYKLGFGKHIVEAVKDFPSMEKVRAMEIVEPESNEEADLFMDEGKPLVVIRLRPESFLNTSHLCCILQHELTHISDMLEEKFFYDMQPFGSSPAESMIVRDRYRILWDINIDSRLIKGGRPTIGTKQSRYAEFKSHYEKLGKKECEAVFEYLWSRKRISHPELRELAENPRRLLAAAGIKAENTLRIPGTLCPVCKFPTYVWAEVERVDSRLTRSIQSDAPNWMPEHGICERCFEAYALREREDS